MSGLNFYESDVRLKSGVAMILFVFLKMGQKRKDFWDFSTFNWFDRVSSWPGSTNMSVENPDLGGFQKSKSSSQFCNSIAWLGCKRLVRMSLYLIWKIDNYDISLTIHSSLLLT